MEDRKDLKNLSPDELKSYIRRNVNFVNQALTEIENAGLENASRSYRYVQDKLINRDFMRIDKNGNLRFKSTNKDLESLNRNSLYALSKYLQNYKNSETGTVYKYQRLLDRTRITLNQNLAKQGKNVWLSESDMNTLFEKSNWDKNVRSSDRLLQIVEKYGVDTARYWIDNLGQGQSILEEEWELKKFYDKIHAGEEEIIDFSGKLFL